MTDPQVALAEALHLLGIGCRMADPDDMHIEEAASILAALDGWTLVRSGTIEGHRICEENMEAEIARLRKIEEAARALDDYGDTGAWSYPAWDLRFAALRAALAQPEDDDEDTR